ncbi:MAG: S16 family serine protease [Thermofilaceae archaeon]
MPRRTAAVALVLALLAAQVLPAVPQQIRVVGFAWVLVPAVTTADGGYRGTTTNVTVLVTEGWGDVYVSTYSLTQEDFQGAATAAARVVCSLLNLSFSNYNFYFKVIGPAVIVGGPSAGVAMAVAVYSALTGQPINRSVMVTGMISPDGTVGPVGGVYEKAQAVASAGAKVFLVPPGQSIVTVYRTVVRRVGPFRFYTTEPVTVNLAEEAKRQWGLTVIEVATLREALRYFFGVEIPARAVGRVELSGSAIETVASVRDEMRRIARSELEDADRYLNGSQLSRLTKTLIGRYLSSARSYLSSAESARGVESIPLFTYSVATSRWVRMLVDYYSGANLEQYVNDVEGRLRSVLNAVEEAAPSTPLDVNRLIIAADLAVRAYRLYNASASTWSSDPATALQYLAYCSAFLDEARLWLNGVSGGGLLDARDVAQTYLTVARTTWSYVYSVLSQAGGSTTLMSMADTYYTASTSFYSSGRYLLAAVAAAKCVATSEAALLSFQAQASGSSVYAATSRDQALAVASEAPDQLAAVYYLNLSATTQSTEEALIWLKHATHLGTLAKELSPGLTSPSSTPGAETPQSPQQPEREPQPSQGKSQPDWIEVVRRWLEKALQAIRDLFERLARLLRRERIA